MRVALFASAFHPYVGGVEEVVRQLAHGLRRMGNEAIVLTNRWPRSMPLLADFEGIRVYRIAFRAPERSLKSRLSFHLTHRGIAREVSQILREEKIDVINVHCVSANALYAMETSRKLALPLVVTSHSERTMDPAVFEPGTFMRDVLLRALATADQVTACSRNTLDDLILFTNGKCATSRVIFNGIDLREFERVAVHQHSRPYLLALGRLVKPKGFDILLRAFAESGVGETHDLILAGDGPEAEHLRQLNSELGIAGQVLMPGRADRAQVLTLMKGSEFFVLPSRHEGFPMVCLEAMATGKAIVATAVGGVPESVVHGTTGLLVEKENTAALANAISQVATDADFRDRLARAGRKRVEDLSWDSIAQQYQTVFTEASISHRAEIAAPSVIRDPH